MSPAPPLLNLDGHAATLALLQATADAATRAERRFVLLNRSRDAWPYQTALLWGDGRVLGHSGVGEVEQHGPYAQWLARLVPVLQGRQPGPVQADDVPPALAAEWADWWPDHALWLPLRSGPDSPGLLLARELPWAEHEWQALGRWYTLWHKLDEGRTAVDAPPQRWHWREWLQAWRAQPALRRRRILQGLALGLAALLMPVRLTVRAPGELVPRDPVVLRAAVDGTVRALAVQANQLVKAGQVLAELDDAGWSSRLQVSRQNLLTAEAEWRQTSQQALNDPKAKAQLAAAQGKFEERRAEVAFLAQQVQRSTLTAPHDGVVLIQDAGSWPGRTVTAGEPVMKLARPDDQEVEAWLAAGDAIDLPLGAPMHLHLQSHPGSPVAARLRLYGYEAEHRADLGLGYRLRGSLEQPASERLGARGTVRVDGPWVPLVYWVLRRPLAALREATGW